VRDLGCGDHEVYLDFEMHRVICKVCGVKNETLDFLSDNTRYTLRFAMQIGGLCRAMTITDVARLMHLDWHTVKDLDKIYMREQLPRCLSDRGQKNLFVRDQASIAHLSSRASVAVRYRD